MIRKALLFSALIFLFGNMVQAQFHIGPKAGVNIGKVDGKSFKNEFSYSYLVGGFAEIGLGSKVSINPEVLFSQTTTTIDSSYTNLLPQFNSSQLKAKLNYLSIPIMLNVKLVGPLHVEAGPQFGIIIDKDKKLLNNGEDAFKKGDFSLVAGAGLNFNILRVSARYLIGLNNISNISDQDEWKSQAIQLSLGLAF